MDLIIERLTKDNWENYIGRSAKIIAVEKPGKFRHPFTLIGMVIFENSKFRLAMENGEERASFDGIGMMVEYLSEHYEFFLISIDGNFRAG